VLTSSGIATVAGNAGLFISTNVYLPATSTVTAGFFVGSGTGLTGVTASSVSTNGSMIGFGASANPLGVNPSSGTLQGNTFNGPSQLAQLNAAGNLALAYGVTATSVSVTGAGGVRLYGANSVLTSSGIATVAGNVGLFISTNVYLPATSTVTAGYFVGNGVGLTNVPATFNGGTVSGQTTFLSTVTIQGNAFSVGGSTLVVIGGNVGIGTTNPTWALSVATPTTGYSITTSSSIYIANQGSTTDPGYLALVLQQIGGAGNELGIGWEFANGEYMAGISGSYVGAPWGGGLNFFGSNGYNAAVKLMDMSSWNGIRYYSNELVYASRPTVTWESNVYNDQWIWQMGLASQDSDMWLSHNSTELMRFKSNNNLIGSSPS
jgi:hypothetical protein